MKPHTRVAVSTVVRLLKGIVTALEEWMRLESST
jgi:hypothetical protein